MLQNYKPVFSNPYQFVEQGSYREEYPCTALERDIFVLLTLPPNRFTKVSLLVQDQYMDLTGQWTCFFC